MDSQCIQVSSSKSISVPNVRGDFDIYIAKQSATLRKSQNGVLCDNMNMDVSAYILKFKFFKTIRSATTVWIHVGLLWPKSEMIYLPKKVCLIIIYRNTTHLLDMSWKLLLKSVYFFKKIDSWQPVACGNAFKLW